MNPSRYRPYRIPIAGIAIPVFPFVYTTGNTIITQTGVQTCTPASMAGIAPFMILMVYPTSNGVGTPELIQVLTTSATSFTANFAQLHSGYYLVSQKPGDLGQIQIGNVGTNAVLTLYEGAPALAGLYGSQGTVIGSYPLSTISGGYVPPSGYLQNTLFYTITGTGFQVTIWYQARYS